MNKKNFITLEGGEGSGKTTTAKVLQQELEKLDYEVIITREPGGSPFSEKIRTLIMENDLNIEEEALLFATARVNHLKTVIEPALKENKIVICDRFIDSSIVYQEYVGKCKNVKAYNQYTFDNCLPSKTFFFDIKPEQALQRLHKNARKKNRFDQRNLAFHQQIYGSYQTLFANKANVVTIDATKSTMEIVQEIIDNLELKC
ncbi:MAG: dTMP kinase [Mycoplasmatales bacterium]